MHSRAFIRNAFEDDALPVPSPTYLLQQVYEGISGIGNSAAAVEGPADFWTRAVIAVLQVPPYIISMFIDWSMLQALSGWICHPPLAKL